MAVTTQPRGARRGGPEGNALLTTATGIVLIVLLGVLGITILLIDRLMWLHLFLGIVLIGPVALKLATTGYRFVRYYARDPEYVRRGPPPPVLRVLAPGVVLSTVIVFASGVALLLAGPAHRSLLNAVHKASFILWLGCMGLHVLGHLPEVLRLVRQDGAAASLTSAGTGGAARAVTLAGVLIGGVVLAMILIPRFAAWTGFEALRHLGDH